MLRQENGKWRRGYTFLLLLSEIVCAILLWSALAVAEVLKVDPALQTYKAVSGVSGNLSSVGSDTLNNLMTFWAETLNKFYPNVKIQIEGKGSSTAPPALISGTAQLGPMSRPMKGTEIDAFEKKFGHKPTGLRSAVDALAIFGYLIMIQIQLILEISVILELNMREITLLDWIQCWQKLEMT